MGVYKGKGADPGPVKYSLADSTGKMDVESGKNWKLFYNIEEKADAVGLPEQKVAGCMG